jgi:Flp pilus assembly protein TadD
MSRFVNLELGDHDEEFSPETSVDKGAAHYFECANDAFANMDFEEALRTFSKVLEYDANHTGAWTGQVRALIELDELREALTWADRALEGFPNEPELLAAKAVALGRSGEQESAMAFSDTSIATQGETAYVWLARADVLLSCREERAQFCFEKAMVLAAGDWLVAWLAARIRYWHGQFMLALGLAQRAVEWNPSHPPCWMTLAHCQQEIGLVGPARESLKQVDQLRPRWEETRRTRRAVDDTGFFRRVGGGIRSIFKK